MNATSVILQEIRHRAASSTLAIGVLALAVATVHFFLLSAQASENETRIIQRDAGLNLLILPAGTDLDQYWATGFSKQSMPQDFMLRLVDQQVANRLVPLLQKRINVAGTSVMLTGIAEEVFKNGSKKKQVYGLSPQPGKLFVGSLAAQSLQLTEGESLSLLGTQMQVELVLPPAGTVDDSRIYTALEDAQKLLALEGQINEIQALECHCADPNVDAITALRAELEPLLPGAIIVRRNDLADARLQQRQLADKFLNRAAPIMVLLCGFLIAALAAMNLRERRPEIGIFHALGFSTQSIIGIFLGRSLILGFLGALAGTALGLVAVKLVAPSIFNFASSSLGFDSNLMLHTLWIVPAFALAAASLPLALALNRDPVQDLHQF